MKNLIDQLPRQCREGWELGMKAELPTDGSWANMMVLGMGGSGIGGEILAALARELSELPVSVNKDYSIPRWVSARTLTVAVSYSGNTEETLWACREAHKKGSPVLIVTTGGKLSVFAGANIIQIPAGLPPRAALGYLLFSILALCTREGLLDLSADDVQEAVAVTEQIVASTQDTTTAPPARLASQIRGHIPLIYGGSAWGGVAAQRWKCQFNENTKCPAFFNIYPELNHNEIVGWEHPERALGDLAVIHLCDHGYHPRIQKRMTITRDILLKKGIKVFTVKSAGKSLLSRLMSLVIFGDYVSYYLAKLYGVDPTPVAVIDYLKEELRQGD